uniref:Uncharacterized protein n=1 Tax=Triticum urartu TaxID=4572 RepID=A0A8R7TL85_TRIUA
MATCSTGAAGYHAWAGRLSCEGGGTSAMAIDAAAASPLFLLFGDPEEEDEDDESEVAGSGDGRLSPAAAAAACAAAISEPMRSGKLRSAREPRMRYAARS